MPTEASHAPRGRAWAEERLGEMYTRTVRIGDVLRIAWTVVDLVAKPKHGGGIVVAEGVAVNQHGVTVCTATGKMLVGWAPDRVRNPIDGHG